MRNFGLLFGLAALTALFLAGGTPLPVMLLFPAAVAYYWVHRQALPVILILLCALAMPILVANAFLLGVVFFLTACFGVVLGMRMQARLSLGWSIALTSVFVFLLNSAYVSLTWQESVAGWRITLDAYREQTEAAQTEAVLGMLAFVDEHWVFLSFGMLFGLIALTTTGIQVVLYRKLVPTGRIQPSNHRFGCMRVPEHLVWVPIALAILWFIDSRWPLDSIRFIAWNGAIALAIVYWINGLSIIVYGVQTVAIRPLLVFAFFALVFVFRLHLLFAVVGFFDTWWDFRMRIRLFAEAAQKDA